MKTEFKRTTINYDLGIYGSHTDKGYRILVNGANFCYLAKDGNFNEWNAFVDPERPIIFGGLTYRESKETFLRLSEEFKRWTESDNVIKTDNNTYKEQTTQYKKEFTFIQLLQFYFEQYR